MKASLNSSTPAHTLAEADLRLNRPAVVISGLPTRFELPASEGAGHSDAYLAFLKTVVCLRTLVTTDDNLVRGPFLSG